MLYPRGMQSGVEAALKAVQFLQPARAQENLARLREHLAAAEREALPRLLPHLPDPDAALNNLERFASVAPTEVREYLGLHPPTLHHLLSLFSFSAYLSDTLIRQPALALWLEREPTLHRVKTREEMLHDLGAFTAASPDAGADLTSLLARFKRREYLRIALRDILRLATLPEVTLELSSLADAILQYALERARRELEERFGTPLMVMGGAAGAGTAECPVTVLSLGKLGGNELNYSSDVDVIFLYRANGETTRGISNKEYFVKLAHRVVGALTTFGPEGSVFRVDLRLRPQGREGDMACSLEGARQYYRERARDWELQALIKARHSAGDAALAREFLDFALPLIYQTSVNFAAIDSVLFARERTTEALKRRSLRGLGTDVKLEHGGIRDVEFLVQCLQRLYGGQEPWLRSGGTMFALQKLADKGYLRQRDYARLSRAYVFLRNIEHLLQLERGQQTHRLPGSCDALAVLARRARLEHRESGAPRKEHRESAAARKEPRESGAPRKEHRESAAARKEHRESGVFGKTQREGAVLAKGHREGAAALGAPHPTPTAPAARADAADPPRGTARADHAETQRVAADTLLAEVERHMKNVREIYDRLILAHSPPEEADRGFTLEPEAPFIAGEQSYPDLLRHIESNCPPLYRVLTELPVRRGHKALRRFISSAYGGAGQFAFLCDNPHVLERAADLFEHSPFLSELLIRHPEEICELAELPPPGEPLALEQQGRIPAEAAYVVQDDPLLLHVAASDAPLTEKMSVMRRQYRRRLLRVHAHSLLGPVPVFSTLEATSVLAEQVLRAAYQAAVQETARTRPRPSGNLIVVALGRLGIREFDIASDADLGFLYRGGDPEAKWFWTRVAERLIEMVSAYTGDGTLFAVDSRLRPRGREGELVEAEASFAEYFASAAQPWEAITYMKSRVVAGDMAEGTVLLTRIQNTIGERFGRGPDAVHKLAEMRKKLEATAGPHNRLKAAPGGYYDIDFILTYLRLQVAQVFFPSLTTPERLRVVEWMGQLRPEQAQVLRDGAVFLRALEHALRVSTGRSDSELPLAGAQAESFARLAERWLPQALRGRPIPETLGAVTTGVRRVFHEVFG